MMKTLTLNQSSTENLLLNKKDSPENEIKSTDIQEIFNINNANNNRNDSLIQNPCNKPLPFYLGISEVLPSLYLCGACAIARTEILENLDIKFVVNATVELPDTPLPDYKPDYLRVAIKDAKDTNIIEYFDKVADLIEQTRQADGKSLVHCVAGVSRSVSLVLAYLMKYADMTLKNAFQHVRNVRPQVRPNVGFFKQLIAYEERLYGQSSVSMIPCAALNEEIPDVYEPEYRTMELLYQKYRRSFARR